MRGSTRGLLLTKQINSEKSCVHNDRSGPSQPGLSAQRNPIARASREAAPDQTSLMRVRAFNENSDRRLDRGVMPGVPVLVMAELADLFARQA